MTADPLERRPEELGPESLRRRCDPATLDFESTATLVDLPQLPGQERALEALRFGIGLRAPDYHVLAVGQPGLGKHAAVRALLEERAARDPVPDDWCYVHDFDEPHGPRALRLPAGRAGALRSGMDELVTELEEALRAAAGSTELRAQTEAVAQDVSTRQEAAVEELARHAAQRGFHLERGPGCFSVLPARDGKPLADEAVDALPADEKARLRREVEQLEALGATLARRVAELGREAQDRTSALVEQLAGGLVRRAIEALRARFADLPQVTGYLAAAEQDMVQYAGDLLGRALEDEDEEDEERREDDGASRGVPELPVSRRYRVNVLSDHAGARGAPVVHEDHPTCSNLFGRIEHVQVLGALLTDFNLVKGGALHRANGGYLILDAPRLLEHPVVWEGLKRALRSRQLRLEEPPEALGGTVALEPAPIPLDVKVVLVGEPSVHELLLSVDPEATELFKVLADFSEELPWTDEAPRTYARLLATICRRERVRPLDRTAAARIVEESARRADDRERLSLDLQALSDLVREADRWAEAAGAPVVAAPHVQRALDERARRSDRPREELLERIARGTTLIAVTGSEVGQVNALAVQRQAGFTFGAPIRITARARVGRGQLLDVDREVELAGPIHSKGVLILEGFLGARYAADVPLSLAASLVSEQNYGMIEGDSASVAELCCLLSAIAEVPLRQEVAITGSVNQLGRVQPVGGVNHKVEGFFDVCRRLGLTGTQGVIVPRSNCQHLMLREDVVQAAAQGRFHVWAVDTVDQALELLAGLPAGVRDDERRWTEGSVNARVQVRLDAFALGARTIAPQVEPAP